MAKVKKRATKKAVVRKPKVESKQAKHVHVYLEVHKGHKCKKDKSKE